MTLQEIIARCRAEGECLVWTGFSVAGRPIAHTDSRKNQSPVRKLVIELRDGPMPPKTYARATCATVGCVWHVKAMTRSEQMLTSETRSRGERHSTIQRKSKRAMAPKLSEPDVARMRALRAQGWTYERLGKEFNVHLSMAARVCTQRAWAEGPTHNPPKRVLPNTEQVAQMRILKSQGATYRELAVQFSAPFGFVVRMCKPKRTVRATPPGRFDPAPGFERAISADWMLRRQGVAIPTRMRAYP